MSPHAGEGHRVRDRRSYHVGHAEHAELLAEWPNTCISLLGRSTGPQPTRKRLSLGGTTNQGQRHFLGGRYSKSSAMVSSTSAAFSPECGD